jgi:hypothetical protein
MTATQNETTAKVAEQMARRVVAGATWAQAAEATVADMVASGMDRAKSTRVVVATMVAVQEAAAAEYGRLARSV